MDMQKDYMLDNLLAPQIDGLLVGLAHGGDGGRGVGGVGLLVGG